MKDINKQKKEIRLKRKAFSMLLIVFVFMAVNVYKNKVSFATTCKGPSDVILAIDNSANMLGTKLSGVKSSSVDFIYKEGDPSSGLFSTTPAFGSAEELDYHQIGLATFNSNVTSWSLTRTEEDIQTVVESMIEMPGTRNITDAVGLSRTFLLNSNNYLATKTIVLITSGNPMDLTTAINEVRIAKESTFPIRTITIGVNFDEIVNDTKRANAINFINNQHVLPNDCYYTLSNPEIEPGLTMKNTIENCNYEEGNLDASLESIVNDITSAVCDGTLPTVNIYRIPSGTLYDVDELKLVSNAIDSYGFSDHYIEWIATPPGAPINVINNCSIVGTSISCNSGTLGTFISGTKIDYSSYAVDSNSNESIIIDGVTAKDVTVATVSATIPALLRNTNQEFKINIDNSPNLANLDNFYIRIDNGSLERVVDEQDAASEMISCSLSGTTYSCKYPSNIDCAYYGNYPNDTLDVYYYVKTGGVFHSGPIFQVLNLPITEPSEGIGFNNSEGNPTCSDGIDNNCVNGTDGEEILACDGTGPTITKIQRASPPEGTDVIGTTGSVTIITEANDTNGIKEYEVQFNVNSGGWVTKYTCIDLVAPFGKCDGDGQTMDSVTSSPIDISSYPPGTVIEFRSIVTDNSGNNISSTSAVKSFLIKSSDCTGIADLSPCAGGQCCGYVCNTSVYNNGPEGPYDEDECTSKTCNGTRLELEPDPTLVDNPSCIFDSGATDYESGCYSYQESYANPPDLFGEAYSYFNQPMGGCEIRNLRCYDGYCKAQASDKIKSDDYCGYNSEPLRLADYSCVGGRAGTCDIISTNINDICDTDFGDDGVSGFDWINSYSSDDLVHDVSDSFISGDANIALDPGSVYETKNVLIRISAFDTSGVDNIEVYLDGSSFKTCNCAGAGTCICQAEKTLTYSDIGQTFSFYAVGTDINTNTETTNTYNFVVLDSDCSNRVIDDPVTYHIVNMDTAADQDPLTGCGQGAIVTGECCGGVCNATISNPNLFNTECYTDVCTGTVWTPNLEADGTSCGSEPSCSVFYTGCRGGNECTAGFCYPSLSGIGVDSCGGTDGKYLTNKGCESGNCGILDAETDIDCSDIGNYDNNDTNCNCDCGGYDIEEKTYSSLEFDGVDDYVEIPDDPSLNISDEISVEAWVKDVVGTGISQDADVINDNDFVSRIRASGGDYDKLSTWEAAIQSDLTSSSSKVFSVSDRGNCDPTQDDGQTVTFDGGGTGTLKHLNTENKAYIINCVGTINAGDVIVSGTGNTFTISDTGQQIGRAIAECYNDWPEGLNDRVKIDDWTTNADNYVKFYTPITERHNGILKDESGDYTGFALRDSIYVASSQKTVEVIENYTVIDGLIVVAAEQWIGNGIRSYTDGSVIKNNIIYREVAYNGSTGSGIAFYNTSGEGTLVYNNIVYGSTTARWGIGLQGSVGRAYNNTVYLAGCGIDSQYAYNNDLKNNIVIDSQTADYCGSTNGTRSNNISSDGTAPGADSLTNQTLDDIAFVSTTPDSENLHLQSTSVAIDAGADLSATFISDIDRMIRTDLWDIGADEYLKGVIVSKGAGGNAYSLTVDGDGNIYGNINSQNVFAQITDNNWHHVVLTYDGTYQKIYLDGVKVDSKLLNDAININANDLIIGKGSMGMIDEVRIYDRALFGQEVADKYENIFINNTNLIGYWNFDKGSGGIVSDSSVNGNDGTFGSPENGPEWKKYHSTSSSGLTGNVPLHWQVCNDGINNDCDGAIDGALSECDGMVNNVAVDARSLRIDITQATAVAELSGESVSNITFTGGLNYVTAPVVTIFGVGTDASATAVIDSNGAVSAINIDDGGSGYTATPTVTITEGDMLTNISGNINDSDISTIENKFTLSTDNFDDSNILQSSIEWTADDWTTKESNACSGGICNVCISGGDCENEDNGQVFSAGVKTITVNDKDWVIGEWAGGTIEITYADSTTESKTISDNTAQTITVNSDWSHIPIPDITSSYSIRVKKDLIDAALLSANGTFKYKACATDNSINHNYRCTDEYSISIIDTNRVPAVDNLLVTEPQLCAGNFNYKLEWEFVDDDLADSQKYYQVQVKETNDDFSIGPLVLNYKGGNSEYHFIQPGGSMRTGTVESSGTKKLFDDDAVWIKNEWQGGTIEIISGTGTDNGVREIISNEETEIVVGENWITDPDATSVYEIKSVNLEYGGKTYYWRVRVTDDKSGGLEKVSDWQSPNGHGPVFTTPPHKYPDVDFIAVNDDSDQCAYDEDEDVTDRCSFGEEIYFKDISDVIECLNDDQCLYSDKAMCNNNSCDACTNFSQCSKFGDYLCNAGICEPSATFECSGATPCKTLDLFKCSSLVCSPCEDDTDCDGGFECDDNGKCIESIIRQWDFYDNAAIDSTEEEPTNIYIESKKDFYTVTLYRQDISGQSCPKRKNIPFEGRKYPKWNEVSSSN